MKKIIVLLSLTVFAISCKFPLSLKEKSAEELKADSLAVVQNDSAAQAIKDSLAMESAFAVVQFKSRNKMDSLKGEYYSLEDYPYTKGSKDDSAYYLFKIIFRQDPLYPYRSYDRMYESARMNYYFIRVLNIVEGEYIPDTLWAKSIDLTKGMPDSIMLYVKRNRGYLSGLALGIYPNRYRQSQDFWNGVRGIDVEVTKYRLTFKLSFRTRMSISPSHEVNGFEPWQERWF